MNIKKQYKRKLHTIIHNDVKLNKYDLHIEYKLLKIIKFFNVILFLLTIYKKKWTYHKVMKIIIMIMKY